LGDGVELFPKAVPLRLGRGSGPKCGKRYGLWSSKLVVTVRVGVKMQTKRFCWVFV